MGDHGTAGVPILLDLSGNGLSINPLFSSSQFLDLDGDGYQHRTAWAGAGNGVLVLDADGDGKISRSSEFVFTEWDQTATSDLDALKSVFDTNHNGLLDAGDARWSEFKVMVDGQLVSLASLGIASIGLTATGSGQNFADGSAITGTSQFTRTDGTTGAVGDAVLVSDADGYIIKTATVTNGDGSKTTTLGGYDKDGTLAFQNRITLSADRLSTTTQFDDDGNGTYDRTQIDTVAYQPAPPPISYTPPISAADIVGTDGADHLVGTAGNDVIRGGDGNDTLYGKDGDDFLIGGGGTYNQADYDGSSADYTFTRNADGSITVAGAAGVDTLVGIGGLWFADEGEGGQWYSAEALAPTLPSPPPAAYTPPIAASDIVGTDGADHLVGTAGNDVIRGGDGNDTLYGKDGDDFLIGGGGTYNQADYDGSSADYTFTRNADGSIRVASAAGVDTLVGINGLWFADEGEGGQWYSAEDLAPTRTGQQHSRTIANFAADGSLIDKTVVTTSGDLRTVTTTLDQDGDGAVDQTQVFMRNLDGSTATTISESSVNGTLLRKVTTTASADGLTKTVQSDSTGRGVYDLVSTETTVVAGDGTRTKTVTETSSVGALIDKEQTVTSADGRARTVSHDLDGNGTYETGDVTTITGGAGGAVVTTVSTYSSTNVLIGKTVATTSSDGLAKTVSTDLNGDGLYDLASSDVTVVGAGGSLVETQQVKSADGTLLSSSVTSTSADRKTISISTDADGDGHVDSLKTIVIDEDGATRSTLKTFNANGSLRSNRVDVTSADGLSLSSYVDLDGDEQVSEASNYDLTTFDATGNRTRTVSVFDATAAPVSNSVTTTSADSLTQTVREYLDVDEIVDRTTVTTTALGGDGSRTVTTTKTSANGALLAKSEVKTSADRKTTTTKIDANGDTKIDRTQIDVVNADGSQVTTASETDSSGAQHAKRETTISGDGLTQTDKQDVNGDGVYDAVTQAVTVIGSNGIRTTTISQTSSNGTLLARTISAVSANGLSIDTQTDADGNGVIDGKSSDITVLNADGSKTRTVSELTGTGALIGKLTTVTSANGQTVTTSSDLDGDGLVDTVSSDVKLLGSGGSSSETLQVKSRDGSLLSSSKIDTSADHETISIATDSDGDGHPDSVKTIVMDATGVTTSTTSIFNPNGTLVGKVLEQTSPSGASRTTKTDLNGDGVYDVVVTDASAFTEHMRTLTTKSANGTLIGTTTTTASADGLLKTVSDDIDGDGMTDRLTTTAIALGADGGTIVNTSTMTRGGGLLSKTEVNTSGDGKTTTTRIDSNGDTKIDRLQIDTVNAGGSYVTTISDTDRNGVQHAKSERTISADGLIMTDKQDLNGDGVYDAITQAATVIAVSGTRTTTTSQTSTNGTLLSQMIATVSANGLSIDTQIDADGNGVVESKSSDVTVLNADGSTTRTVSAFAGTGALIGKAISTTTANGLTSTIQADLDGNGTIDRTLTAVTALAADGSKTDTVTVVNGNNVQISRLQQTTGRDGHTVTTTNDVNGNGKIDETRSVVLNADGSVTEIIGTFANNILTSKATHTVSANGLSSTLAADIDGNGTIDQSMTDVIVLNADGSKTETITNLDAAGAVKDRTIVVTSANGLSKSATWAGVGSTTSRSKTDVTVLNADGSTTQTVDYKKANGSLESRTVATVSADKLTTTVTTDVNGDGAVDLTSTSVRAADGSVTTTTTGPDTTANAIGTGAYTTAPSTISKTTTISADGLSTTTQYGSTSVNYMPTMTAKATSETAIGLDGASVATIKTYQRNGSGTLVLSDQTRATTAGNGFSTTKEWDVNGDGTYDRKETDVTVLNADGSTVSTLSKFEGSTLASTFVTTASANGLSVTTNWDIFGSNPFSQDMTDVTVINADGTKTRTVTNLKADGSPLSKFVTTTTVDGRVATTQEDIDGVVGFDRTTTDDVRKLADGAIVETVSRLTTAGVLLDREITTTSGDGRTITINRDANGDGTIEQTELTTKAVDGSSTTVITDFSAANQKSSTTKLTTSADGLLITSEWDFDGNGTVDRTRRTTGTRLGNGLAERKTIDLVTPANTFVNKSTTYTSDDGRSSWTGVDYDTSGDGFDNLHSTIVAADGSVTEGFYNRRTDVAFLASGGVYYKQAIAPQIIVQTSADGRTTKSYYDYNAGGPNPINAATPSLAGYEITAVSHKQIDGSVVTEILEHQQWDGPVIGKGIMTVSADGLTTTLLKDADNNGTYEHQETAVTRIDGSVQKVATDTNISGAVAQTVTTDVSANGRSVHSVTRDGSNHRTEDDLVKADGTAVQTAFVGADEAVRSVYTVDKDGKLTSGTIYDPKNTDPWTRVEQSYSGGKKTLEKQFMDDGTRIDIIFDAASGKQVQATTYDVSNRATSQANYTNGILATNVFYDPANAQTWSTVTQVYNAAGQMTNQTVAFDNGTRSQTNLDPANVASWRSGYYEYDAANRPTYEKTVQDDSTSREIFSDPANAQSWSTITRLYNAAAQKTTETVVYDNGTHSQTYLDPANVASWRSGYYEYDAANRLTYQKVVSDDGSGSANTYDPAGVAAWSRIDQYFDTADRLYYQNEFYDNGTRTAITLDPGNAQPWTRVVQYFDTSGRMTFQNNENDGGTSTAYTFDVTNAQSWSSIQNNYNTVHQQILEVDIWDDGTRAELTYDGPTQYVMGIKRFNAGGTLTQTLNADQAEAEFAYDALQNFDLAYYLQANPDVAQGWQNGSAKRHFMMYGWKEGRLPKAGYHMPARHTLDLSTTFPTIFNPPATGGGGGGNGDSHGHGPVALDLNGDGQIELSQLASTADDWALHFDWAGDGIPQQTSWIGSGDGFLAIDLAADGSVGADGAITQAKELQFNLWVGDSTTVSDLEGLRLAFDSNHDNEFDNQDARWNEFRVFQDANQNGVSEAGELKTLAEAGITRIGLISNPEGAVQYDDGSKMVGTSWYETTEHARNLVGDITLVSRFQGTAGSNTMVGGAGDDQYQFMIGHGAATIVESGTSNDNDELDFGAGIDWNELWFSQQGNNLVVSVLGTTDKVTINDWFAGPGNVVETIKSGDGKVLHSPDMSTLVAAMAGFDPATSPTGSGIQPNDPRLGNSNEVGTIAAAMQQSWMAA
ncbi:calcium-binding protein [Mesorhizobium sp. LjRoot246]|uniref:calcium-binding protein n=1 Tax=Mesorhizobium sp. LjRoot246 TaxID=3342294 RepID=UPI003ECF6A19